MTLKKVIQAVNALSTSTLVEQGFIDATTDLLNKNAEQNDPARSRCLLMLLEVFHRLIYVNQYNEKTVVLQKLYANIIDAICKYLKESPPQETLSQQAFETLLKNDHAALIDTPIYQDFLKYQSNIGDTTQSLRKLEEKCLFSPGQILTKNTVQKIELLKRLIHHRVAFNHDILAIKKLYQYPAMIGVNEKPITDDDLRTKIALYTSGVERVLDGNYKGSGLPGTGTDAHLADVLTTPSTKIRLADFVEYMKSIHPPTTKPSVGSPEPRAVKGTSQQNNDNKLDLYIVELLAFSGMHKDFMDLLPREAKGNADSLLDNKKTLTFEEKKEHYLSVTKSLATVSSPNGTTALIIAAIDNLPYLSETLISAGVKINAYSKDNGSAAWAAVKNGSDDVVELLIKHGADFNAEHDDLTPYDMACFYARKGHSQIKIKLDQIRATKPGSGGDLIALNLPKRYSQQGTEAPAINIPVIVRKTTWPDEDEKSISQKPVVTETSFKKPPLGFFKQLQKIASSAIDYNNRQLFEALFDFAFRPKKTLDAYCTMFKNIRLHVAFALPIALIGFAVRVALLPVTSAIYTLSRLFLIVLNPVSGKYNHQKAFAMRVATLSMLGLGAVYYISPSFSLISATTLPFGLAPLVFGAIALITFATGLYISKIIAQKINSAPSNYLDNEACMTPATAPKHQIKNMLEGDMQDFSLAHKAVVKKYYETKQPAICGVSEESKALKSMLPLFESIVKNHDKNSINPETYHELYDLAQDNKAGLDENVTSQIQAFEVASENQMTFVRRKSR